MRILRSARIRWWRHAVVTGALSVGVGCAQSPRHHALPEPVNVPASFDKTWAAVIDIFATGSIPIRTMEKASGLIVAEPLRVGLEMSERYADCGSGAFGPIVANRATYNVRVTGDSAASLVRVTAAFSSLVGECTSLGAFERFMMGSILARATGKGDGSREDRTRPLRVF